MQISPKYPVYIVSKKRADSRLTSKEFERINIPYHIVIDESEYDDYAAVINPKKILIMPEEYRKNYDTFDDLGLTKSVGPGCARNFCWDHSMKNGHEKHWVFDDNVRTIYRLINNEKIRVSDGTCFKIMEDFCDRYTNIAIAGMNYQMFVVRKQKYPPFVLNTRIYSMLLVTNSIPYRWRGRYNEDTDISLRVLKDGWCTCQFNAFIGDKIWTQQVKGGNTEQFYSKEGTYPKSEMQVRMHPDVSKLVWKFNRWHHHVDYSPFKKNKLIRKAGVVIPEGVNNYGMVLKKRGD
jgi:hypothetical protein